MPRLPAAVGFGLAVLMAATVVRADDGWNPFKDRDQARRSERPARQMPPGQDGQPRTLPPMDGAARRPWLEDGQRPHGSMSGTHPATQRYRDDPPAPWRDSIESQQHPAATFERPGTESVERRELQPLPPAKGEAPANAPIGTGPSSADLWRGLDPATVSELIEPLRLPPKSAALARLWQQLLSSAAGPAAADGNRASPSFDAIRMQALHRSGLVPDLRNAIASIRPDPNNPVRNLLVARTQIELGEREPGCSAIKGLQQAQLPKPARHDFLRLASLCGVGNGDAAKAAIAADLLRAEGVDSALALASLDALASGNPASFQMPSTKSVSLLDYRFLELVSAEPDIAAAEPALLSVIAMTGRTPDIRIRAAEAAFALHAIQPGDLVTAYRSAPFSPAALAHPFAEHQAPPLQRALLFKAFESERTPVKEARFARALLDEVRRVDGPYLHIAALLAPAIAELRPSPELAWFAETAIEIALADNRVDTIRDWASTQSNRFDDWLVLADISAAHWRGRRGEFLPAAERRAVRGELPPELMHRLVTVLDALDYQIPIPLWEAASKTEQPARGFLPETGVLSSLQKASHRHEQGKVVLLAMRALGPDSGETAHMIALGDTIRALKRVGLEADARRLGLEALFGAWPRSRID